VAQVIGNPTEVWKAHAAFGDLRDAEGKREEARAAYTAAGQIIDGVHARLTKPELKTALRRAAFAQRLLELSR